MRRHQWGPECVNDIETIFFSCFRFASPLVGGQPPNPRDFFGMTRVFKDLFCCSFLLSGETEASSAGTQLVEG